MDETRVVDASMVEVAQGHRVGQVGAAEPAPRSSMVELAPGEGSFAAVGRAGLEPKAEGDPLRLGEQSLEPAEVEDLGPTAEHGRGDAGGAGEPPSLTGGDPLAGVEPGRGEGVAEGGVVECHDDRRRGA